MYRLNHMKEKLIECVQKEMGSLEQADTKELGEAIDMIKDLEEAIYYATITHAMTQKDDQRFYSERYLPPEYMNNNKMYYVDPQYNKPMHDWREGSSGRSRKMYMESKEMHHDKASQIKELENYMHELSKDITEMITDASTEERQMLYSKLTALASKVQ